MKVLIAVASKHGSTREIAQAIAAELDSAGLEVDLLNIGEVASLDDYEAVVFGSAIYAGNWLPIARQFAEQHQAELTRVPVWLFSSGPLGAENPKPQDDPQKLAAPMGQVPVRDHRVFVGKLDTSSLDFAERLITRMIKPPEGDFRDWEAIRSWARDIATALKTPVA